MAQGVRRGGEADGPLDVVEDVAGHRLGERSSGTAAEQERAAPPEPDHGTLEERKAQEAAPAPTAEPLERIAIPRHA